MFTIKESRQLMAIVCTKMERFGNTCNGGMVGETKFVEMAK